MSARNALHWARAQKLHRTPKAVLVNLASRTGGKGYCYPGQQAISDETGLSVRTVRNALAYLEEAGFITREKRYSNGRRTSDYIHLNVVLADSYIVPMDYLGWLRTKQKTDTHRQVDLPATDAHDLPATESLPATGASSPATGDTTTGNTLPTKESKPKKEEATAARASTAATEASTRSTSSDSTSNKINNTQVEDARESAAPSPRTDEVMQVIESFQSNTLIELINRVPFIDDDMLIDWFGRVHTGLDFESGSESLLELKHQFAELISREMSNRFLNSDR